VRNPHHLKVNESLVIMRINKPIAPALMGDISRNIRALSAFYYDFS